MDKVIPFPQADDFDKIVHILSFPSDDDLNSVSKISSRLGDITERQVAYYISAAMFLGLIEIKDGKKVFTAQAQYIKRLNTYMQYSELISIVLLNPVFNKVYVNTHMFGKQETDDVINVIKKYYPDYSDSIYSRRAQTVISWVDWVSNHLEQL